METERTENVTTEIMSMETPPKKKKGKVVLIIILIAAVLAIPAILNTVMRDQIQKITGKAGTPVNVETVSLGNLDQVVELSGVVQTEESKTYFAPVSAKISKCDVKTGDTVKAGEKLVEFDTSDMEEQLETGKLEEKASLIGSDIVIKSVNAGEEKVAKAAAEYDEASAYVAHYNEAVGKIKEQLSEAGKLQKEASALASEIKEYQKAVEKDPEDKKSAKKLAKSSEKLAELQKQLKDYDVDALNAALETCSGDLAEYKAKKEQAEVEKEASDPTAGLQKSQQAVNKEIAKRSTEALEADIETAQKGVTNEFEGVIVSAAAQEGQLVQEGLEIFTVQSTKNLKVTLAVGKTDLDKLAVGQDADITIAGKEYTGKVSAISRIASTSSAGSVAVDVDVHINAPDDGIILGTEGKVSIRTAEKKSIVLVPMVCLNYSSDSTYVYLVKDGKLVKSVVETGISDDEMIEIISGVEEGDEIVSEVPSDLEEGMDVISVHEKVNEIKTDGEK